MKRNKLALAVAGLLLVPAAGTIFAQTAPPSQPNQAKELQTITVTGSALPRVDTETPSPVAVITAAQIERSGLKTVSDVVRSISADNSGSIGTSFSNGFASGAAGVSLRGLTVNSTLVLIDARRSASYPLADDGQRTFVDLNSIPMIAVDRIEVLKDGASSVYGADAVAGVVNIILKHDFKGVQASAEYGDSQHGGGATKRATLLFGGGDLAKDGFNAYGSVEAQKTDAIFLRDRDFPYNTLDLRSIGGPNNTGGQPLNRSGSYYGTVRPGNLGTPGDLTSGSVIAGQAYQPLRACGADSNVVTVTSAENPRNPGTYCSQNFLQNMNAQPETKRLGVYGRLTVKVGDTSEAYLGLSYYQNQTQAVGGPSQIQASTPNNTNSIALPVYLNDGTLNPNNPFAAQNQVALINYAFPGQRQIETKNHNLRLIGGMHGTLGEWNYDSALVINHVSLDTIRSGYVNYPQLLRVIGDGSYNFIDPSRNSAATYAALLPTVSKTSTSDLQSFDFHLNRELMDLRGGALGVAVGADVRHEAQNDPNLNENLLTQGLGVARTNGQRSVGGLYFEFDAPLLEQLEADASGRFDHYSDFGNAFSPKLGLKYKPFDSLLVRGTFSRGFRAPSFPENGSSESVGFARYAPSPSNPADAAFIAAHGNNAYVQPYSIGYDTVGNKNIKPERSKSYTFGAVFQPIDELSVSADYYDIKKTRVIGASDPQAILTSYYTGQPLPAGSAIIQDRPDPDFPNALPRATTVLAPYVNQNSLRTKGLDIDLIGRFNLSDRAKFISELTATKIFSWDLTLQDGTKQRFVGTHGPSQLSSGAGTPQYRASWANSVIVGPATITGTFYYTSDMSLTAPDSGVGCLSQGADGNNWPKDCRMSSFTSFDLTGSYDINDHFQLYASILNAFDRKPPLDPLNYAGASIGGVGTPYNPTYDQSGIVGRFYTVGVKFKM